MKAEGSLGCNDYETMMFKVLGKISKENSRIINNRIITLYFRRMDFDLSRGLLGRIPLQSTLEGKEAQQSYLIFMGNFLYAEDHPFRHAESRASIAEGQQG